MTARSRDVEAWLAIDLSSAYVLHPLSRQYFEPFAIIRLSFTERILVFVLLPVG